MKLRRVCMGSRVDPQIPRDHSGSHICAIVDVHRTVEPEFTHIPGPGEIYICQAFRSKRVSKDRVEKPQVEFTGGLALPPPMREISQRAGELQGPILCAARACRDPQEAQVKGRSRKVQRGLKICV